MPYRLYAIRYADAADRYATLRHRHDAADTPCYDDIDVAAC